MIFEAMKGLVESLVTGYKCECSSNIGDKDIDIIGAAGNTATFDIVCPKCGKHGMIKSQIIMLDEKGISNIQHSIQDIKEKLVGKSETNETKKISDTEIISLSRDLKEKQINVSDLFE